MALALRSVLDVFPSTSSRSSEIDGNKKNRDLLKAAQVSRRVMRRYTLGGTLLGVRRFVQLSTMVVCEGVFGRRDWRLTIFFRLFCARRRETGLGDEANELRPAPWPPRLISRR